MKYLFIGLLWLAGFALNDYLFNIQDDGWLIVYGGAIGAMAMAIQGEK